MPHLRASRRARRVPCAVTIDGVAHIIRPCAALVGTARARMIANIQREGVLKRLIADGWADIAAQWDAYLPIYRETVALHLPTLDAATVGRLTREQLMTLALAVAGHA